MSDDTGWLAEIHFDENGLVPAIAQDADTGKVLMVAWMNAESVAETVATGHAVYFSRSRQRLWRKGEESGHVQTVREIRLDCDGDVLLLQVEQAGGIACHTGRNRCFFRRLDGSTTHGWTITDPVLKAPDAIYQARHGTPPHDHAHETDAPAASGEVLSRLADTLASRLPRNGGDPATSYAAKLLARGPDAFLKKIGEEATEFVMASKDGVPERIVSEAADLWFHCLVALTHYGLRPEDVERELLRREGTSGLVEKASRPRE
ncbi:MAG TPA: bifunctional phosphoribosyl-AMP cyclohydrolase/phosphoribosyl-ATP diphosphatase HisIE [Burkholderiaceae bacterium]|nr:bifunctional phosphoribosyl-AMP cyclohydrolase/phosphoribosyl-ATP diphosphatase HisIE [Burkholderiaceae bacterium]